MMLMPVEDDAEVEIDRLAIKQFGLGGLID
jgi:hypothetical protein